MANSGAKHFKNPYRDYSPEAAADILVGHQLKPNSQVVTCIETKWRSVIEKFQRFSTGDDSVYTGAAGVALLYFKRNNMEDLQEVKALLNTRNKSKDAITFLCGASGPIAIAAAIAYKLGENNECNQLISRLASLQVSSGEAPEEHLYGKSGYLYSLLFVNKHISPPPIERSVIRDIIKSIIEAGIKFARHSKSECPLMYIWHRDIYLGAAHGVAGIMYILLVANQYLTSEELENYIKPTIDYLATLRFSGGNYPIYLGQKDDVDKVQWCHGAPGFVYMFTMAYKVFDEAKYLNLALEAGDVVWERGILTKGYSICHGVAGNAYSFLDLYQTTGDVKHLYRAVKFAEYCVNYKKENEGHSPDRPLSLFEGIAGPMYFLLDLQNPKEARFPGFGL